MHFRYLTILLIANTWPALCAITVDTTIATDWKISNGVVLLDWNSNSGHVFSIHLAGRSEDIIDVTNTSGGQPKGLYMDNTGFGAGTTTAHFRKTDTYVDWWTTTASNTNNAFTYSQHFILADNDAGIHTYFVAQHGAADIAGSIGQVQFVFRVNLDLFPNTYSVDSGLNNRGPTVTPMPPPSISGTTDPGRQVQDATVDLHGFDLPAGSHRRPGNGRPTGLHQLGRRAHVEDANPRG